MKMNYYILRQKSLVKYFAKAFNDFHCMYVYRELNLQGLVPLNLKI